MLARRAAEDTIATPSDTVFTYLPVGLDVSFLPPDWRDYGAWVVGGLYLRRYTEKYCDRDDFRPVSSEALRRILPKRDYLTILRALITGGVIKRDHSYRAGTRDRPGRCRGYRLTPAYRDGPFHRVRLTHRELVRKVLTHRAREADRVTAGVHRHLREWLARLEVAPGAPCDALPLARIDDRDFFFTVCRQGRVHTNLTNLARDLRPHLRVGGQPLWGIDVVNSQPLLLGLTLTRGTTDLPAEIAAYRDWLADPTCPAPPSHNHATTGASHLPYVGTYSGGCQNDLGRYLELCLAGRIYERLVELTGYDRDTVKPRFLAVAYGDPQDAGTRVGRAFQEEFPAVWEAVRAVNGRRHGELARRMQVVESYLVVWLTCGRLMREYLEAPLLTLHDCLVADEAHVEPFGAVLQDEFVRVFGVKPGLKSKPFA